jgi:CheY-like chemotaxis protein
MIKVLLIDDEQDFCELLKANLEMSGEFEVVTANNGNLGIMLAQTESPDIILLDIIMPGIDGATVSNKLKENPATRGIPIIFLTALITPSEIGREGRKIKGKYFYAKPVDTDSLINYIHKVLAGSEQE